MNLVEAAPRETSLEAGGYAKGLATAIVTQNKDPEGLNRVKVRYPWYDQPRESHWARLAMPMAGKDRGVVLIPEIGDEVVVGFEREDLRFPYVLGAVWNGPDAPPEKNANGRNDRRLVKSRKGHHLLFDDGTPGVVELALNDGKKVVIDDKGLAVQDDRGNAFRIDSTSGAIEIHATGRLTIKATSISLEATGTVDVKAGATMTLRGTLININ